ncbi:MAG: hypothetical protein DSZ28_06140 [Thiothrix sp.]|nr:MAG: hypothetical protein DSZ28_06140 [Thiothrix sp.]
MPILLFSLFILLAPGVIYADQESPLTDLLGNTAVCEASSFLLLDLPPGGPLYSLQKGQCERVAAGSLSSAEGYFADAACSRAIRFESSSFGQYCREEFLDPQRFGNGAYLSGREPAWRVSQGARLDISVGSVKDNHQPFMTQAVYKDVMSVNGQCQLEMRIYKKTVGDENLKPLIMLHGGSWKLRQSGYLGAEAQVSHFTEKGFVVFAPFYRLTGAKDGNIECNGVGGEDIVKDIDDALTWVLKEGRTYGAAPGRVFVTGQSAGAHLAGWLVTHRAADIERGLLLYPPTDFADFISQWRSDGMPGKTLGLSALEGFVGEPLETIDLNKTIVTDNSFPSIVEQDPGRYAPLFIIHGASDGLVPVRQAERLCNAYAGSSRPHPVGEIFTDTSQGHKQVFNCDERGSQLHVITEADHVLDVCLKLELTGFSFSECPAGGSASQQAARESLDAGREWLAGGAVLVDGAGSDGAGDESNAVANSSGGGAFGLLTLVLAALLRISRWFRGGFGRSYA